MSCLDYVVQWCMSPILSEIWIWRFLLRNLASRYLSVNLTWLTLISRISRVWVLLAPCSFISHQRPHPHCTATAHKCYQALLRPLPSCLLCPLTSLLLSSFSQFLLILQDPSRWHLSVKLLWLPQAEWIVTFLRAHIPQFKLSALWIIMCLSFCF